MSTKILVVDDEIRMQPLLEQRFRRKTQAGEYIFLFATSGSEALQTIRSEPNIDVILLDINMPDISGLDLLIQLPELLPVSRAVMVSAYGDIANVRTAMNRGAFDFIMKPINFTDLELTIEKTVHHISQLRESIRAKTVADLKARFFDNLTHEFRTPLSLIIAPIDSLLKNHEYDNYTQRSLHTVRRNAHQLLHLINQLLDLARLEADTLPRLEACSDLILFLNQVVDTFRPMAEQKRLSLEFTASLTQCDVVFDADKWQKILSNLLSNALKFTESGGSINVICQVGTDEVTLSVKDTGIGIASEHLPHLFDRFYQVDNSLTRAFEGSGIGLALAYELTRHLNGYLTVKSVPGEGTEFIATIPIAHPRVLTGPDAVPGTAPLTLDPLENVPPILPSYLTDPGEDVRPLVLLVEDNGELLSFLAESLSGPYRILTATNGRQGLEIARQELPDVVVSDVMMPEIDGYQLTRQLKEDSLTDHIAVILLTARTTAKSRRDGLTQGADDYLIKPFDLDELRLRLRNIINRQQALRAYFQKQLSGLVSKTPEPDLKHSDQDAFLEKLMGIVEQHLDDSEFKAELLAAEVAMSLRTLTRKLATLGGVSPARFIRTYRLHRATELLRAGHPISETAYMVGFEHPANFSTAFKEVYHQTPSEFLSG